MFEKVRQPLLALLAGLAIHLLIVSDVAAQPTTSSKLSAATETRSTPPSSPDVQIAVTNARLDDLNDKVKEQQARLVELELNRRLSNLNWGWALLIASVVAIGVIGFAWNYVRKRLLDPAIQNATRGAAKEAIESAVASMRTELLDRTESELIRFARVLALVDAGQFDAALTAYGWKGEIAALRAEHRILRRAIIQALYSSTGRSHDERQGNRDLSWRAAQELIEEKHDAADLRLYLTIATKLARYDEALEVVLQKIDQLGGDLESVTRAATILRRVNRLDEAVKLLNTIIPAKSPEAIVTQAALFRDYGRFDEAHTLLLPAVQNILDLQPERLEEAEARVINTFVANCIDRGKPQDGLPAANLILERLAHIRPIEIATTGRLLMTLNDRDAISADQREAFQRRIGELPPSEVKVHCQVYWHRLNGETIEAEKLVAAEIDRTERRIEAGSRSDSDKRNAYFFRCLLGELLLRRGEADEASKVLIPATKRVYSGEAYFLLAKSELKRGDAEDAVRWLSEAVQVLPKWRQVALDDELLTKNAAVMASLNR